MIYFNKLLGAIEHDLSRYMERELHEDFLPLNGEWLKVGFAEYLHFHRNAEHNEGLRILHTHTWANMKSFEGSQFDMTLFLDCLTNALDIYAKSNQTGAVVNFAVPRYYKRIERSQPSRAEYYFSNGSENYYADKYMVGAYAIAYAIMLYCFYSDKNHNTNSLAASCESFCHDDCFMSFKPIKDAFRAPKRTSNYTAMFFKAIYAMYDSPWTLPEECLHAQDSIIDYDDMDVTEDPKKANTYYLKYRGESWLINDIELIDYIECHYDIKEYTAIPEFSDEGEVGYDVVAEHLQYHSVEATVKSAFVFTHLLKIKS